MESPPEGAPLLNDPARDASDTMRAYNYQVLCSVLGWLQLQDGEVLYLEGAEDFDRVASDGSTVATQVKDTARSGSLTLRTPGAVEAINNYFKHRQRNPGRTIRLDYLTTSGVGREQGAPFGPDMGGIELWRSVQGGRCDDAGRAQVLALTAFLLENERLAEDVRAFLREASPDSIHDGLIKPIRWLTDAESTDGLVTEIESRLIELGGHQGVPPPEAKKAVGRLCLHVWRRMSRPGDERCLSRASLLEEFSQATHLTLPRAMWWELAAGVRAAKVGSDPNTDAASVMVWDRLAGGTRRAEELKAVQQAFGAASRALLAWPQVTDGRWLERPELQELITLVSQGKPTLTVLLGGPGEGKSALLARLGVVLVESDVVLLALKADQLPRDVQTLQELDAFVGTPLPLSRALRQLAAERRVVLLIDQLDALADLMDQHSARLSTLLRLVASVRGIDNLHVVLSCREFEYRNDVRLASLDVQEVTLDRLKWEQVLSVLTERGLEPTGWSADVQDVLRTPQHLGMFLSHLAEVGANPTFGTYQDLLEGVLTKRLERPFGARTVEAAEHIATVMAEEEELWLGRTRFERQFGGEVKNLEAAGFLVSGHSGRSIAFRHQTVFDFLRARAFARQETSLATYVLEKKQESLFVRPALWSALHYLRAADPAAYRREFRHLWLHSGLRVHLRYLLISFLGRVAAPEDEEAQWMLPLLDEPVLRDRVLRSTAGSPGWFSRVRDRLPSFMNAAAENVWPCIAVLRAALAFEREGVLSLIEQAWLGRPEHQESVFKVLSGLTDWDERSSELAAKAAGHAKVPTHYVQELVERIAESRPELAPAVLVRHLTALTQAVAAQRGAPPPAPPPGASVEDQLGYQIQRNHTLYGSLGALLDDSKDWYALDKVLVRAPRLFAVALWPWLSLLLQELAADPDRYRNVYRGHHGLAFTPGLQVHRPLASALETLMRAFAKQEPDAFLQFVEARKDCDLMSVHNLLARGLCELASERPHQVLAYLLEEPRRLAIGDFQDLHRSTRLLIGAVLPKLSADEVLRLELAILDWPLYRVSPLGEDARTRFERKRWTREHRLRLLRSLPSERLSARGRRFREEEERALPHTSNFDASPPRMHWVGSPMSADQMGRAADGDIATLFEGLPDATEWDHPKRRFPRDGGSIPASRAFAEFARAQPERALGIIERFTPGEQERPAGSALAELGKVKAVPTAVLVQKIHGLVERGFSSSEFRSGAAQCLRDVARRAAGLDDATCALLESWIEEVSPGSEGHAADAERAQERECRSESLLWGHGGGGALPNGNYPYLEALEAGYLLRPAGGTDAWLALLERHLSRRELPAVWCAVADSLPRLALADHGRANAFLGSLFDLVPELIQSEAGVHLVARTLKWLAAEVRSRAFERWESGDWLLGPQAAGELAVLHLCLERENPDARARAERYLDGASLSGIRLGVAFALAALWGEPELRSLTTPLLVRLVPGADLAIGKALLGSLTQADRLPADAYTRDLLVALVGRPELLVTGETRRLVECLADLLRQGFDACLVHATAAALIGQVKLACHDARTPWHLRAEGTVELALTLHRLPTTRSLGLDLFEQLLGLELYPAEEHLGSLDRIPFR